MAETISLREKKKAKTKLALLEAALALINEGTFRSVLVDDICAQAEVSKVTFFKFFPQKEELLIYFMSIWQVRCYKELADNGKRGFAAVRHVFSMVAQYAEKQPGIMLSLISFLAEQKMHPCVPALSEAELSLLFPDVEAAQRAEIGGKNMHQIFEQCVQEAREDGQLVAHVSNEEAVVLLFSMFYGAYLSAHLFHSDDFMAYYELHLKTLTR
ncbi:TetR family transcriptional regulator [Brevibacillus sp. 1238]|uniref:TetR/AcrR family transcriptional regulator n=1 Tax=Brevibacillus sp. 1238 TaxID=2940565 RepID=UPI002475BC08|nr:TetR family transcriptional regulator [Brevibacillus sp. 1238]MDH6351385.1 AcrR family transcriptional regulator [Brevibacillus sp. 1238]